MGYRTDRISHRKDGNIDKVIFKSGNGSEGELSYDGSTFTFSKSLNVEIADIASHLGTAVTPLTRTNHPVIGANTPNANISALDNAIGENGDMTEVADAQLKIISRSNSLTYNLDALDARTTVKTVKVTIGGINETGCTFNVATEAGEGKTEQVFTLVTLPAKSKILEVMTFTDTVFVGTSLVGEIGTSSSGHEIMDSTTIYAASVLNQVAADHAVAMGTISVSAKVLYFALTPGDPWHHVITGKVSVYITYVDISRV
jgi:hypothetical protein